MVRASLHRVFEVEYGDPYARTGAITTAEVTLNNDGTVADAILIETSGQTGIDSACVKAAYKGNGFGHLPQGYAGSLKVRYKCTEIDGYATTERRAQCAYEHPGWALSNYDLKCEPPVAK
jgi:hypothetical protein